MFGIAAPGRCGMIGRTLCVAVHGGEGHKDRAARPPASLPALCEGYKGLTRCSPCIYCAVAGVRLARERSGYGFLAVVLCRLSPRFGQCLSLAWDAVNSPDAQSLRRAAVPGNPS